jgi:hypothetical protein
MAEPPVLEDAATRRHLAASVRAWLGLRADAAPPTLPDPLARTLLRLEEHERDTRDRWGNWEPPFSERPPAADIDDWVAAERARLAPGVELEPLWPDGRRFAICLTHDVDLVSLASTPRQVLRFARGGLARDGSGARAALLRLVRPPVRVARSIRLGVARAPSTAGTLETCVQLEAEHGVTASYLFTVPPAGGPSRYDCTYAPGDACVFRGVRQPIAHVMRTLAEEGFDVGLHGSYPAAVRPGALAAERATLERATTLRVTTTRQHFVRWDVRRTPRLQEEAGLGVDSTLGFNTDVGHRSGTSLPYRLFDVELRRPLDVLEVPFVAQDGALLGPFGRRLDLPRARETLAGLVEGAERAGAAVTVVFHPDKLLRPDWLALYEWLLDHAEARGAWTTSLGGLQAWWLERERQLGAA